VRLEKYQRNSIFRAIEAGGLDPNECDPPPDTEDASEVRITHTPSGSYFILGGDLLRHTWSYVVGDGWLSLPYEGFSWSAVLAGVRRWAEEVKLDADTPDLWAQLRHGREILTGAGYEAVENTHFTPDEQTEIAKQLREIKEYLEKTHSLSSEQMLRMEARFDELEGATRRVGRKDWLLMFGGAMFALIVTDLLPPEAVQHIFAMAIHGLELLLGSGGSPGQLPPTT